MKKSDSKCLVIDACIARSAGETEHPVSSSCRELLFSVLEICHKVVMTDEIYEEWKKHASFLALKWLATMKAQKKYLKLSNTFDKKLREDVSRLDISEKKLKAVEKDIHLIEAALAADKIVISTDDIMRDILCEVVNNIGLLKEINWANPIKVDEKVIEWLENGAILENGRFLRATESA